MWSMFHDVRSDDANIRIDQSLYILVRLKIIQRQILRYLER